MTTTGVLATGVGIAYVLLGTVNFRVATEAVLRYARMLGIPEILPSWFPDEMREWFPTLFRWSTRLFFLGCAYTHFEIAAHAFIGDLPPDYGEWTHTIGMFLQFVGAWFFVFSLTLIANELRDNA